MTLAAIIIATLAILANAGHRSRKRKESNKLSVKNKNEIVAEHQRKQRESDEIITVILPTIDSKS